METSVVKKKAIIVFQYQSYITAYPTTLYLIQRLPTITTMMTFVTFIAQNRMNRMRQKIVKVFK